MLLHLWLGKHLNRKTFVNFQTVVKFYYITQCACIHLYSSCFHQRVEYLDWLAVLHVTSDSLLLLIDHFLLVVAVSPISVYSDSQRK